MFTKLGRFLRLLYYARVPVLTIVTLGLCGPVVLLTGLRRMLGALFDLDGSAWELFSASLAAFLAAAAAITAANLLLWHGKRRMQDANLLLDPHRHPLFVFFSGLAAAVSLVVCACTQTDLSAVWELLASFGGLVMATTLVLLAKLIQLALTDKAVTPTPPPYLVFPLDRFPNPLSKAFDDVYRRDPGRILQFVKSLFATPGGRLARILRPVGQGYFGFHVNPPKLLSGHVFAIWLALMSLVVYLVIGWLKEGSLGKTVSVPIPSLTYVLLFLMVACWALSALAFFFDRYRFPFGLVILGLCVVTSQCSRTDHFYRVEARQGRPRMPKPAEVLMLKSSRRTPLVIAAAGGGIHAAAWTTRVLQGIDDACRDQAAPCDFQGSIALVSGVSGGSVGAMYYGAAANPKEAAAKALESSLDEVAWGWINPDVRRALALPVGREVDRGWALERSWETRAPKSDAMLAQWAARVADGFPAFVFNSTIVEQGRTLVFSTTDFPAPSTATDPLPLVNFYDLCGEQYDVRVSTAVRLSASFPYVAPNARPSQPCASGRDFHLADGGYYDNYGVLSAIQWLDEALAARPVPDLAEVKLLVIRSFPPETPRAAKPHGWFYQTHAPLDTFLNVRDNAQLSVAWELLDLLGTVKLHGVKIDRVDLAYPDGVTGCEEPPLSWKLTGPQKACVDTAWKELVRRGKLSPVLDYLRARR